MDTIEAEYIETLKEIRLTLTLLRQQLTKLHVPIYKKHIALDRVGISLPMHSVGGVLQQLGFTRFNTGGQRGYCDIDVNFTEDLKSERNTMLAILQ